MIAGGPNASATDCAKAYNNTKAPARSYYDNSCSYATNEVAINWNAPFAYVIGSLQAIASTGAAYDVKTEASVQYELTAVPFAKKTLKKASAQPGTNRIVVRGHKVLMEKIDENGLKHYFDMSGKLVR